MNVADFENLHLIDSPSLLILKDKVESNIDKMVAFAGDSSRLMPHIKTNKMENVIKMMMSKGITQFKAATIAEAELAAISGAKKVLISHQLVGPKIKRLIKLIEKYPNTIFASLVDCDSVLEEVSNTFGNTTANVYYDINVGMNRTGHEVNNQLVTSLTNALSNKNIHLMGLHVYDGHVNESDFENRKNNSSNGIKALLEILESSSQQLAKLEIIAGGTPTFTSHLLANNRILSPGTCVLWDWGYGDKLLEQNFEYAALICSRVISKPTHGIVTLDMGHKSISAENPIDKRVKFLNRPDLKLMSQSEEHGVAETTNWEEYNVGDVIIGVPYHVCPTVNLYDEAQVFDNFKFIDTWQILGRKRKITI